MNGFPESVHYRITPFAPGCSGQKSMKWHAGRDWPEVCARSAGREPGTAAARAGDGSRGPVRNGPLVMAGNRDAAGPRPPAQVRRAFRSAPLRDAGVTGVSRVLYGMRPRVRLVYRCGQETAAGNHGYEFPGVFRSGAYGFRAMRDALAPLMSRFVPGWPWMARLARPDRAETWSLDVVPTTSNDQLSPRRLAVTAAARWLGRPGTVIRSARPGW